MSDERMRILKMLKEGRITLEEAEVLLDAVGGADAEKSSAREEAPHAAEHTGAGWWGGDQQKKGPASWLDFGWKLDPAHFPSEIQEAMKGFAQSMKDAFSNIQKGDYLGGLKEMFGRVLAQTSRRESVPAAGVRRLSLKNRWGDVHISGGDAPEIGVAASISAWGADPQAAQALADSVEISHYREGDTLSLRAEAPDSGHVRFKVDFDVTVPRSLAVEVKSMSGDIVVSDAEDGVNAVNLSGDIIVQSCAGELVIESKSGDLEVLESNGVVRARTISGDIELARVRSVEIDARTTSGSIRSGLALDAGSKVKLSSTSGDIGIDLPEDASCEISAETASGEVRCDLPVEASETSPRKLRGRLHGEDSRIELSTKSGDITIRDRKS